MGRGRIPLALQVGVCGHRRRVGWFAGASMGLVGAVDGLGFFVVCVPNFEGANAFFKCEFGIKNHKRSIQEVAFGLLQRLGGVWAA